MNFLVGSKRTAVWRYAALIVLGALVLGALIILIASFRSVNASSPSAPSAAAAALQATAPPSPTAVPTTGPGGAGAAPAAIVGRITGNLVSVNQASLSFQMTGRILEFRVKEGDKVKQGDVLASLDTATLQLQVAQAQAALTLAQARLTQTQKGGTPDQVAVANQALELAKANYAKVLAGPTPDDLAGPKANLDRAQAALNQAQAAYDKAGGPTNPYVNLLPTTLALQQATSNYQAALGAYNLAKDRPTPGELAGAAAQLAQAESLAAQVNPTQETLTIAQAQVDQAQAALDLAKQTLANATIVAPFDGTVVWIGPHVGENANTQSPAIILADLSRMQVEANVDELTLAGVHPGQRVTLQLDVLGDRTLTGRVSKIGLYGSNAGGLISVSVWVDVDPTDAPIFPGLTATVQFDAGQ